jgi:hypothetical protein
MSTDPAPAEFCAERVSHAGAGARSIFLWSLGDDLAQLELVPERVAPWWRQHCSSIAPEGRCDYTMEVHFSANSPPLRTRRRGSAL